MKSKKKLVLILALGAVFVIGISLMSFTGENGVSIAKASEGNSLIEADGNTKANSDIAEPDKTADSSKDAEKQHQNQTANQEDKAGTKPQNTSLGSNSKTGSQPLNPPKNDSKPSEPKPAKPESPKAETPKHTHSWQAVYSTRQLQKTRQVAWTKCYACGADMTGNPSHIDKHLENHDSNVHYGTEYRTETYYVTESYISGYRCSCGATK